MSPTRKFVNAFATRMIACTPYNRAPSHALLRPRNSAPNLEDSPANLAHPEHARSDRSRRLAHASRRKITRNRADAGFGGCRTKSGFCVTQTQTSHDICNSKGGFKLDDSRLVVAVHPVRSRRRVNLSNRVEINTKQESFVRMSRTNLSTSRQLTILTRIQ